MNFDRRYDGEAFLYLFTRQTCRRASHEFELESKQELDEEIVRAVPRGVDLYSLEFLKALHDDPENNLGQILAVEKHGINKVEVPGGKKETAFYCHLMLDYFYKIKDLAPSNSKNWTDLHHFMNYVYRNFASESPSTNSECLSPYFLDEMRGLIHSLIQEDEAQVCLRVLATLREYCDIVLRNYIEKGDHRITKLIQYYKAMMGAAKQINEVFDEFAKIMYKNYSEDWTDFNKYVFIRYFWCTEFVQQKVKDILRTRASPGDPPGTLEALETIQNLWITKKNQIKKMNADHSLTEGSVGMFTEDLMIDDHRKVLAISFWVKRIDEKKNQNLKRFNHHIFQLLIKPDFQQARPLVDTNGECICEECMIAYFDVMLQHPKGKCGMLPSPPRRICCRRCRTLLPLDNFHLHVKDHADKVGEISLKDILKNNLGRSPVLFEDSPEDSEI